MSDPCRGGDEAGVDWVNHEVIHENDDHWHAWDPSIYGGNE